MVSSVQMVSRLALLLFFFLISISAQLSAQTLAQREKSDGFYSRRNTFSVFAEYSNDSSHIVLGNAQNRKLLDFGATYAHRVLLRRSVDIQYMLELRPILLESDPLVHAVTAYSVTFKGQPPDTGTYSNDYRQVPACHNATYIYTEKNSASTSTSVVTTTCGAHEWTFGEGFSPGGVKFNFLPRHRLQPVFTVLTGYMLSTNAIPFAQGGSFNFTFEIGAGLELYRKEDRGKGIFQNRSLRAEYRLHHLSNAGSAEYNPGIDNSLLQVTYSFGK